MIDLPEPDWYLDNVLLHATPGRYDPAVGGPVALWRELWQSRAASPDPLVVAAAAQGFVLRGDQTSALGVSRQRARSAVRRGTWTRAGRGYLVPFGLAGGSPAEERQRHAVVAAAAALSRPGDVVSGRSAAILLGLPTVRVPDAPELTARRAVGIGRRHPPHVYSAALDDTDVTTWYGVAHTVAARTLVDLARHDRRDAIMAADAALRECVVEQHQIQAALAAATGWPGVRQARAVLGLASRLAESPLESLVRLALHDDGFPEPELQVPIAGYRTDLLFRAQRLILEADGRDKYSEVEWRRERRRDRRLRALGYRVERVGWRDVVVHWPATRAWLRGVLQLPA